MQNNTFFASLFDMTFSEFVTTKVIKVLYILAIIFVAIFVIGSIVSGFKTSVLAGIVSLILSPFFFILGTIVARIYMELIIVVFRIAEFVEAIDRKLTPPAPTQTPPAGPSSVIQ